MPRNVLTIGKYRSLCFLLLSGFIFGAEASIEQYYSQVDDTKSGSVLRLQLNQLISDQRYISYRDIWSFLEIAHEVNTDSVLLFYTQNIIPKAAKASGAIQALNNYWNREHVWPQSIGLKGTSARRDLHNIVPADRSVNSSRGNKYFDIGGSQHKECSECFSDRDSWEPPDPVKGDIARIIFYMDLRYDGIDNTGAPDLVVVDPVYASKRHLGGLSTLEKWHCVDTVDDRERRRNELVYDHQGNRNPFVDHPHWTEKVFQFNC